MAWCSGGGSAWVGDCLWPSPVIVRGVVPSPVECRKVTLVNCSCHWVILLVSWFFQCPIVWMRFVKHLLAAEPPSVGRHNGDVACWQAREPQKKIGCLLPYCVLLVIGFIFILWLVHSSTRWYNHPTHSFIFLQSSCSKLFSVISIEGLLCYSSLFSGAL